MTRAVRIDWDVLSGRASCSRSELHTERPSGKDLIAWNREMWAEGYRPTQCPQCGLWVIWEKRENLVR